jgi:hypothetical protein
MFSLALTTASAAALGNGGATLDQIIASLYGDGSPGVFYNMRASSGYISKERFVWSPATAATDPVGFCLDLSQGLAEGPELRGSAETGLTGSATEATYNATTGAASITRVDASNQSWIRWTGLTATAHYRLTIACGAVGIAVRTSSASGTTLHVISANTTVTSYVTGNANIVITSSSAATATFTVQSMRLVAGNHWRAASEGVRPLLADIGGGILVPTGDGLDDAVSSGTLDLTGKTDYINFSAIRKFSDASVALVLGYRASLSPRWNLLAPGTSSTQHVRNSTTGNSSTAKFISTDAYAAPASLITVASYEQNTDTHRLFVNGTQLPDLVDGSGLTDLQTGVLDQWKSTIVGAFSSNSHVITGCVGKLLTANEQQALAL